MTLTIELPPEIEQQLNQAAAREGQDPSAFVQAAVEEKLRTLRQPPTNGRSSGGYEPLSLEEEERLLDELASIGADVPPPKECITYSREDIYMDHD